jgi:hypothetical protein
LTTVSNKANKLGKKLREAAAHIGLDAELEQLKASRHSSMCIKYLFAPKSICPTQVFSFSLSPFLFHTSSFWVGLITRKVRIVAQGLESTATRYGAAYDFS